MSLKVTSLKVIQHKKILLSVQEIITQKEVPQTAAGPRLKIMRLKKAKDDDNKREESDHEEKFSRSPSSEGRGKTTKNASNSKKVTSRNSREHKGARSHTNRNLKKKLPSLESRSQGSPNSASPERSQFQLYEEVRSLRQKLGKFQTTLEKLDVKLMKNLNENESDAPLDEGEKKTTIRKKLPLEDDGQNLKKVKKENENDQKIQGIGPNSLEIETLSHPLKRIENNLRENFSQLSELFPKPEKFSAYHILDSIIEDLSKLESEKFSGDEYVRFNTAKLLNSLFHLLHEYKQILNVRMQIHKQQLKPIFRGQDLWRE